MEKNSASKLWQWVTREEHRTRAKALQADVEKLFTEHPNEAGETYFQHLGFTLAMGSRIALCGVLIIIHGIFPFLFTTTTSTQMQAIYAIMRGRKMAARKTEE